MWYQPVPVLQWARISARSIEPRCELRREGALSCTSMSSAAGSWRTPTVVLVCGAIILTLALGVRQTFGLFLQPMSVELGWGRGHYSFALALSNLIWGLAQPFFGAWADKQGSGRVVAFSALLYAAGLALMPFSTTPLMLDFSAGLLIGLGISGVSFGIILGVVGRAFPPERRSVALGIASAGGSFGQFLMVPFGAWLIGAIDWKHALLVLAGVILATVPLAAAMAEARRPIRSPTAGAIDARPQTLNAALREAGKHSGFWYLTAGFFVCGFQVTFISIHLPVYLRDLNLPLTVAGWALALIGLFNIFGSFTAGYLGARFRKKYVLSSIYFLRAVVIGVFCAAACVPAQRLSFRGRDRLLVVGHCAAHQRVGRPDLRRALRIDVVRDRVPEPPGGQLSRRVAGWIPVRPDRLLCSRVDRDHRFKPPCGCAQPSYRRAPADASFRRTGGGMIPLSGRPSEWREIALWVVVAVAAAVLTVLAFRAYLNPSALIDFANSRLC